MRDAMLLFLAAALPMSAQIPAGVPAGGGPVVWDPLQGGNGHTYEVVIVPGGITWSAAYEAAVAAGGALASPAGPAENAFVFGLVDIPACWTVHNGFASGPWLGGYLDTNTGGWRFAATYDAFPTAPPWLPGQPDTAFGADRLHYSAGTPGLRLPAWDDAVPTDAVVAYVIERDPALLCTPSTSGLSLCLVGSNAAGYRLQTFGLPAGMVEGRTLFSASPPTLLGTGGFLGLAVDPLLLTILFQAPTVGDVFSFTAGPLLSYPASPFVLPPGALGILVGSTWDAAVLVLDSGGLFHASPPVRVAW